MSVIEKRLIKEFEDKEYAHAYMDSHLIDRISTQIYQLRLQRGWTQQQLSIKSGIAQERISLLESGDFTSITMKTLRKLSEAFDVALTIKFESFADAVIDFVSLSVEKLQVDSRLESIQKLKNNLKKNEQMPNVEFYALDSFASVNLQRVQLNASELILTKAESTEEKRRASRGLVRGLVCRNLNKAFAAAHLVQMFGETVRDASREEDICFDERTDKRYSDLWQGSLIRTQK